VEVQLIRKHHHSYHIRVYKSNKYNFLTHHHFLHDNGEYEYDNFDMIPNIIYEYDIDSHGIRTYIK